jgi:hypothetical protein
MSSISIGQHDDKETAWEPAVRRAVRALRFGSVEVVVHEGRVVQIETREKFRFGAGAHRPPDHRGPSPFEESRAEPDDRSPGEGGSRGEGR